MYLESEYFFNDMVVVFCNLTILIYNIIIIIISILNLFIIYTVNDKMSPNK